MPKRLNVKEDDETITTWELVAVVQKPGLRILAKKPRVETTVPVSALVSFITENEDGVVFPCLLDSMHWIELGFLSRTCKSLATLIGSMKRYYKHKSVCFHNDR